MGEWGTTMTVIERRLRLARKELHAAAETEDKKRLELAALTFAPAYERNEKRKSDARIYARLKKMGAVG